MATLKHDVGGSFDLRASQVMPTRGLGDVDLEPWLMSRCTRGNGVAAPSRLQTAFTHIQTHARTRKMIYDIACIQYAYGFAFLDPATMFLFFSPVSPDNLTQHAAPLKT